MLYYKYKICTSFISAPLKKTYIPIVIEYRKQRFIGNKKETLLEQLEGKKIYIPNSCRVGICETCKIKLLSGRIAFLTKNITFKNKWILSCICIPCSDIQLI